MGWAGRGGVPWRTVPRTAITRLISHTVINRLQGISYAQVVGNVRLEGSGEGDTVPMALAGLLYLNGHKK